MEYVYAAMLLHSAKKEITEETVTAVLKGAGIQTDASRVKALIASLKDLNIEEAIEKASVVSAAPAATAPAEAKAEEKEEKEEEGKSEEEAAQGLGSLFG
jgi:large subunit ribosomal protein L12